MTDALSSETVIYIYILWYFKYFKCALIMHLSLSLSIYLLMSIFIHVYNMVIHVFLSFFSFSFNTSENFNVDLSFFLSKRIKYNIQTQLAHIANGKKSCSILKQLTGRKCSTLFGAISWRHPSHRSCLLDVRRSNIVLARYKRKKYM